MLWGKYDSVILDLDGVLYIGDEAVPHAIDSLNQLPDGVRMAAATNNAARTPAKVAAHLQKLGLRIEETDVVTSAQAGARLMASLVPVASRVLAVGGPGVEAALREVGMHPLRATKEHELNAELATHVVGVLQGHGLDTAWWDLATAAWAIGNGAVWVATNGDSTVPTPWGLAPGNGSMVKILEGVVGREPHIAGKPLPALFTETVMRLGVRSPLVIGDRLDTDVDGAIACGFDSLLVLTGVHQSADVKTRPETLRPTYIAPDLRCLLSPEPPVGL